MKRFKVSMSTELFLTFAEQDCIHQIIFTGWYRRGKVNVEDLIKRGFLERRSEPIGGHEYLVYCHGPISEFVSYYMDHGYQDGLRALNHQL